MTDYEQAARVLENQMYGDPGWDQMYYQLPESCHRLIVAAIRKAADDEREACAKLVRSLPEKGLYRAGGGYHAPSYDDAWAIAALHIRARGGK